MFIGIIYWQLGEFIACALHLVIHIGQAIFMRQYIPATITSILFLPISIWVIIKSIAELSLQTTELIVFSIMGIAIVALNLKFAQSLIGKFTRKMKL
ncbi:HXXEE domain-containing protein [Candidatus Pseudoruminococcus sp.]|uniref:HXXEE domain-containing protein n=1 Tax=Candidatus Pseudoruminococcus sp. TaxID=3101048 RepID=UPI00399A4F7A